MQARLLVASVVVSLLLAVAPGAWAGQEQDTSPGPVIYSPDVKITAQTFSLNAIPGGSANKSHLDGQWQSSRVASDGKVYFGDSSHDWKTGGMFSQYDPATGQVHVLAPDIDVITGDAAGVAAGTARPQGKLHSDITEDGGYIYFSTYYGYTGGTYSGGHVIRYQLGSYESGSANFQDFGSVNGGTIYSATSVDPIYGKVYVNSDNIMYRYNADGTGKTNLGNMGGNSFYQFTDSQGNLWTSSQGNLGRLIKIDPNGAVANYDNILPQIRTPDTDAISSDQSGRWFLWGDRRGADKFVFTMRQDGNLYEFDASKAWDGNPGDSIRKVAHIGLSGLDAALAGDTYYFVQAASPWQQWGYNSDAKARDQHLKSVDLNTGEIKDWGRIVDQSGRTPWRTEGMSSDGQRVYLTGDWHLLKDSNGNVLESEKPYTVIRANTAGTYWDYTNDSPWRGQFFAVVNVPEPATMAVLLLGGLILRRRARP